MRGGVCVRGRNFATMENFNGMIVVRESGGLQTKTRRSLLRSAHRIVD